MKLGHKALLALSAAVIELAAYPIPLAYAGKDIGTVQLLFYVFLTGSAASLIIGIARDGLRGIREIVLNRNTLAIVLLVGLFNDAISQMLLGIGAANTNPSIAAILYRSWVIMAAIMVPFALKQRVGKAQYAALLVGFVGIYLMAAGPGVAGINSLEAPFLVLILASAFVVTLANLFMKMYNADTFSSVAIFNFVSLAFFAALAVGTGTSLSVNFTPAVTFAILFLGIITYTLGTTLYYYAFRILGPIFAGNAMLIVPFMTIPLSYLALGTPMRAIYIVAALMLSAGIVLQRKHSSSAPERIKRREHMHAAVRLFDVTGAFTDNKHVSVLSHISGTQRSFAMVAARIDNENTVIEQFADKGCLAFTSRNPPQCVTEKEISFISDALGVGNDATVVIAMGRPEVLEDVFYALYGSRAYPEKRHAGITPPSSAAP